MKILKRYIIITVSLMAFVVLTGCERTELCYDHYPSLELGLEWEHEWERDYGMNHSETWDSELHGFGYDDLRPQLPEWVSMVILNPDGTTSERFLRPEGGKLDVELGGGRSYLFFNGDTEYILLSDMASLTNAKASASTRTRAGLTYINEHHPDARSTNAPDVLYASYIEEGPEFGYHDHLNMNVTMKPLVYTYIIRYEFEYGLEHVALARGALGGVAESVYLHSGKTSEKTSIILFDCDVKDYGCEAQVRSFGVPGFPDKYYGRGADDASEQRYSLNLEILLMNGKSIDFNYDITDQMEKQPRGGVITIKGMRIEDQISASGSGFNVDVTDWPEHDIIDLPIEVEP